MPEFFIPKSENDREQAEEIYASIKAFLGRQGFVVSDRRIFRIEFRHAARLKPGSKIRDEWEAEVGRIFPFLREPCIAIFESTPFLVCTPTRGVGYGEPYLAGQPYRVVDFD